MVQYIKRASFCYIHSPTAFFNSAFNILLIKHPVEVLFVAMPMALFKCQIPHDNIFKNVINIVNVLNMVV